jgi:isopenicillin-N epimerase
MKGLFLLNPEITFLNFGSFGATPKPIFETYQAIQRELEAEPVQFITVSGPKRVLANRNALAEYLNADPSDLVLVQNPTYAVNILARGLDLKAGDEVLTTNLEYGACDRAWKFYSAEKGARYIQSEISLPIVSKEAFLKEFWAGYSENTKVVFISHITSVTGLILPIEEIVQEAKNRGLITIVDGAHAPAHVPLNLHKLDADAYVGACHKWMMSPKGVSFLHVTKQLHPLDPVLISWGYEADYPGESKFIDHHQFNGTRDFSAFLCLESSIDFLNKHDWWQEAAKNRAIVQQWLTRLCTLLDTVPLAPVNDHFIGQMGSIGITCKDPVALKQNLYNEFKIEMPVMVQHENVFIRFSFNAFNSEQDLEKLEAVLQQLKSAGIISGKKWD